MGMTGSIQTWLGPGSFVAAPQERVLVPYLTSTLFPQLAGRARRSFRTALIAAAVTLSAVAVLRLTVAAVTVAALGLPVLFVLYLRVIGTGRTVLRKALMAAGFLGAGLGVAWVLGTSQWLILRLSTFEGLALPNLYDRMGRFAIVLFVTLIPPVVVRLRWTSPRESLDGFSIGVMGALAFTAAATLTRLAPLFTSGSVAHDRPVEGVFVEAVLSGATVPLAVAAAGGMTGILLWFNPNAEDRGGRVRVTLAILVAGALLVQAGLVFVDIAGLTGYRMLLILHAVSVMFLLLEVRVAIQLALLHEAQPPSHQPPGTIRLWGVSTKWLGVMTVAAVAMSAARIVLTPASPQYLCPPNCGRTISALPYGHNPRFTAANGEFTVAHPPAGPEYRIATEPNRVVATLIGGDGGVLQLFSEPANGRSAREVTQSVVKRVHPEAVFAYEIPNAMVGYELGYGEVDDYWPASSAARLGRVRIIAIAAVKNDLALIASAVGPFREFGPDSGPGHPSGANLQIAEDMGQYVNSFTWRGDPPR